MYMLLGRVSLLGPSPDRFASGRDTTPDAIAMGEVEEVKLTKLLGMVGLQQDESRWPEHKSGTLLANAF